MLRLLRSSASRLSAKVGTRTFATAPPFQYAPMFEMPNKPETTYRKLPGSEKWVEEIDGPNNSKILQVSPRALEELTYTVMRDIAHLLRPAHLQQLRNILDDDEASDNDRFVALELLKNANVAAGMVLPGCQDTGTAIVIAKKGRLVWTDGTDENSLAKGIEQTYRTDNLRFSQLAPLGMFEEKNTRSNLPAQIDLYQTDGDDFNLGKTSFQCGRRNDALKFWTLWKSIGSNGLEKIINQQFELADVARNYVANHPDYTLYSFEDSVSICFNYKNIDPKTLCTLLYEYQITVVGFGDFREDTFIRFVTINATNTEKDILNFFTVLEEFVEKNSAILKEKHVNLYS